MRKVLFFMLISLDGYFEGPNRDLTWHNVDGEFDLFSFEQLETVDTLLFGRVTYEMMARFWPSQEAMAQDPLVANKMNSLPKIVFSRTLARVDWNNTRLIKDHWVEEISRLKNQAGKDLIIFGSSDLAVTFIQQSLIDEFRILINPLILGGGKPLFKGLQGQYGLKLVQTRVFGSGNVLLT
jgi:dihydrofolate reductase